MGAVVNLRKQAEESVYDIDLVADVLVIGGGPAGWRYIAISLIDFEADCAPF